MVVKFEGNLAIMPRAEYEALKEAANEAWEDRGTARIVDDAMRKIADGMPVFPGEVVDRLAAGENAVRVFRKWRDMTQDELAVSVGIKQNYLSDIESGKRKGPFELHRKIAASLDVPFDLLAPIAVSLLEADPKRAVGQKKAIAEMRRSRGQK